MIGVVFEVRVILGHSASNLLYTCDDLPILLQKQRQDQRAGDFESDKMRLVEDENKRLE